MTGRCGHEGCTHAATHAPRLNIPATGWAIDLHQPMQLIVGVELCRDHAREFGQGFDWSQNPKLMEVAELAAKGSKRAAPDFVRAFHDCVRLDSEAFRMFQRAREAQ